jgi:hypothetical protein
MIAFGAELLASALLSGNRGMPFTLAVTAASYQYLTTFAHKINR